MICGIHHRSLFPAWIAALLPADAFNEVPTSPPGRPPEPFSRRRRVRYEELDPDELLHLIDRLEDERSRALRREGIWISFIAHLLLFWFLFYGPKFRSHQPHVVNPSDNKKDLTYLDLPPDAQKQVKPKPQAPASDKNRVAQSLIPRSIARPCNNLRPCAAPDHHSRQPPQPAPQQPAPPGPGPAPQQQAQSQPAAPPPPPTPLSNRCSMSQPAPTPPARPSFEPGRKTAGDAIRQAERNAARGRRTLGRLRTECPLPASGHGGWPRNSQRHHGGRFRSLYEAGDRRYLSQLEPHHPRVRTAALRQTGPGWHSFQDSIPMAASRR